MSIRALALSKISENPEEFVFRGLSRGKKFSLRTKNKRISYSRSRENFIKVLKVVNLNGRKYGLHSLRSGGASLGAYNVVSDRLLSDTEKRRIVMKTFIESQFNYCPLIWMFHSQTINYKINRLHERALRIVYSDFILSFEGLLMKDNSFSIHERNIQRLAIEIYKFLNGLSPSFLNNVFHKNISNSYDLRNHKELYSRNPKTVRYGTEIVSYRAPKFWGKVPETIKMSSSLDSFKLKIRKWKPECDCRLCTTYLRHAGFFYVN